MYDPHIPLSILLMPEVQSVMLLFSFPLRFFLLPIVLYFFQTPARLISLAP